MRTTARKLLLSGNNVGKLGTIHENRSQFYFAYLKYMLLNLFASAIIVITSYKFTSTLMLGDIFTFIKSNTVLLCSQLRFK